MSCGGLVLPKEENFCAKISHLSKTFWGSFIMFMIYIHRGTAPIDWTKFWIAVKWWWNVFAGVIGCEFNITASEHEAFPFRLSLKQLNFHFLLTFKLPIFSISMISSLLILLTFSINRLHFRLSEVRTTISVGNTQIMNTSCIALISVDIMRIYRGLNMSD